MGIKKLKALQSIDHRPFLSVPHCPLKEAIGFTLIKSRCLRQMFGVQKSRAHAYEMLPCEAPRAMKTGTECRRVQISDILGSRDKKIEHSPNTILP